jgi:hypothetical protein
MSQISEDGRCPQCGQPAAAQVLYFGGFTFLTVILVFVLCLVTLPTIIGPILILRAVVSARERSRWWRCEKMHVFLRADIP